MESDPPSEPGNVSIDNPPETIGPDAAGELAGRPPKKCRLARARRPNHQGRAMFRKCVQNGVHLARPRQIEAGGDVRRKNIDAGEKTRE
ncbi:MAG: hypothetical protein IT300_03855 [Dehalococcoidia bacterium]|nr:hypothetical protein [Dehalococcoidia bacterium]